MKKIKIEKTKVLAKSDSGLLKTVHRERFLQSRNIKEAQQYLWEASLEHNADQVIPLTMAIWHLEREKTHRQAVAAIQLEAAKCQDQPES